MEQEKMLGKIDVEDKNALMCTICLQYFDKDDEVTRKIKSNKVDADEDFDLELYLDLK